MDLLDQVIRDIRNRMALIQKEYDELSKAEEALTNAGLLQPRSRPRTRTARHLEAVAPAKLPAAKRQEVRLNVLSQTHPTAKELMDRAIVHATEQGKG